MLDSHVFNGTISDTVLLLNTVVWNNNITFQPTYPYCCETSSIEDKFPVFFFIFFVLVLVPNRRVLNGQIAYYFLRTICMCINWQTYQLKRLGFNKLNGYSPNRNLSRPWMYWYRLSDGPDKLTLSFFFLTDCNTNL